MEREEWNKRLQESKWDLERIREENKNLREKKKLSLDEVSLLEKEAKKYYLMRNDSHILKFWEPEGSKNLEEKDKEAFWKRLKETIRSNEKIPPLDVLRVFHISFSIFLILGVFFQLSQKKEDVSKPNEEMNRIEE